MPLLFVRSLLFYIGYITLIVVYGVICLIIVPPLPLKTRYRIVSLWVYPALWWLRVTCGIRIEVEGQEHIPDDVCVVFSKHQSSLETFFLHTLFRPQSVVLKESLLRIPIFGWVLSLTGPIKVNKKERTKALKDVLKQGKVALDDGRWVVIFPEGTRVQPGDQVPFNVGGALLAEKAGYPILPVTHNAGHFWPVHRFIKYPGVCRIVIGPAIPLDGRKSRVLSAEAERWINETSRRLEEEQQGYSRKSLDETPGLS